jgi:enolase
MSLIESCHALEILDSRGNPTLEVTVKTVDGFFLQQENMRPSSSETAIQKDMAAKES